MLESDDCALFFPPTYSYSPAEANLKGATKASVHLSVNTDAWTQIYLHLPFIIGSKAQKLMSRPRERKPII